MKFIITIDVEEDNWGDYSSERITVENVKKIPALQCLFDEYGIRPTYLINYPVSIDPFAIEMFSTYLDQGKCEIGMHCHPWNTPPIKEDICKRNTMLCNLPEELQYLKLEFLHNVIRENFGISPVSFRAGRWGFGSAVGQSLYRLGYSVDTSISPYVNWVASHGPDFSNFGPGPFRFRPGCLSLKNVKGDLLQVPATVGFLQSKFSLCQQVMMVAEKPFIRNFRLKGVFDRIGLVNKVWLSPELANADLMIKLAKRMEKNNFPCINMSFHSTSLLAGASPFVRSNEDLCEFMQKIKLFLDAASEAGWEGSTLSQFAADFEGKADAMCEDEFVSKFRSRSPASRVDEGRAP